MIKEVPCQHCSTPFPQYRTNKVFCSKACQVKHWAVINKERKKQIDRLNRPKHVHKYRVGERTFTCTQCSTPFKATHKRKYCTNTCKSRAHHKHIGPHIKNCQVCNKPFMAKGKGDKNCSMECYKQAEKARYIRVRHHINISKVEKVDRNRVFETYKWHCALCGIHTPADLKGSFLPHEPTLDHIIPLSKGGSHTYDNVQLLCRRCNCAVKNDAIIPPRGSRATTKAQPETVGLPTFSLDKISITGGLTKNLV